jgi:hypothetical protein
MEMIVLGSGSGIGGGRSKKAGNVILNWRKLLSDVPENLLTVAGVAMSHYLIPLAALAVWNKVRGVMGVNLNESQAIVIASLWDLKDNNNYVDGNDLLGRLNGHIKESVGRQFIQKQLDHIFADLERMKAIELTTDGRIWLRELVQKPFY